MKKTTIEFDEGLYEQARRALGTTGLKATVQAAFEAVLALEARRAAFAELREMAILELAGAEVMAGAWR